MLRMIDIVQDKQKGRHSFVWGLMLTSNIDHRDPQNILRVPEQLSVFALTSDRHLSSSATVSARSI